MKLTKNYGYKMLELTDPPDMAEVCENFDMIDSDIKKVNTQMTDMAKYFDYAGKTINFYISPTGNDATGDGIRNNPWKTLQKAASEASKYPGTQKQINVEDGTYDLGTITRIHDIDNLKITAINTSIAEANRNVNFKGSLYIYGSSVFFDYVNVEATAPDLSAVAYELSQGNLAYCTLKAASVNTSDLGSCVSAFRSSKANLYDCRLRNARRALYASDTSEIGATASAFYNCNWFLDARMNSKVTVHSPTIDGTQQKLYEVQNGCIVLWDIPLVISSQGDWTKLTLQNGFEAYGVGYELEYSKVGNKVSLRGLAKHNSGTTPINVAIGTLPAAYRPLKNIYISGAAYGTPNGSSVVLVITASGEVRFYSTTNQAALNTWGSITCSFDAA